MLETGMVIDGRFKGKKIGENSRCIYIVIDKPGLIDSKRLYLNYETVESYRLINRDEYVSEDFVANTYGSGNKWTTGKIIRNVKYSDTVLVIFKDGSRSLILIDGDKYSLLKASCKYNLRFKEDIVMPGPFNINKENKCPHCEQIFYGSVLYCPKCGKLLCKPPKFKIIKKRHKRIFWVLYFIIMVVLWDKPLLEATWGDLLCPSIAIIIMIYAVYRMIKSLVEGRIAANEDNSEAIRKFIEESRRESNAVNTDEVQKSRKWNFNKRKKENNTVNIDEAGKLRKWNAIDTITVIMIIIFFPAGLLYMWINKAFSLKTRETLTIIFAILIALGFYMDSKIEQNSADSGYYMEQVNETSV